MILDKLYLQSDFSNIFTETFGSSVNEGFAGIAVWLIPLIAVILVGIIGYIGPVPYTHLRAHETRHELV